MKSIILNWVQNSLLIALIFLTTLNACGPKGKIVREEKKILIVNTKGHPSNIKIPLTKSLDQWSIDHGGKYEILQDPSYLKEEDIKFYSAIFLIDPSVDHFGDQAKSDLQRYVEAGGGLIIMNSTLSQPYTWPWWSKLKLPGSSEESNIQQVLDVTTGFNAVGNFSGKIFYTNITGTDFESEEFNRALFQVIDQAIGLNIFDPSFINSPSAPDASRFNKVILDNHDVDEPMELAVLPDGKVLFIERKGKMKLYEPEHGESRTIARFEVCTEGNYEDGLLGLAADPDFKNNHYIYLYYSPPCHIDSQYLSRFTMYQTDSIIRSSEKVMLKVKVQRESCCHSGGSISFDQEGNLYLSTGDNTSSKESDGFSPIDERAGRGPFDAQKSSANTHDLRGKILRITPHPYGHYTIPEGNLFPADGSKGRPEIYVMGARNPFRISIDKKTGYLYWGDVGPDGTREGKYGPQSYDEWNQAKSPGNYGWPYFVGNNLAYRDRDFAMDTVGAFFNAAKPVNNSPNNSGNNILPPARPAFIWYGKSRSSTFPMLGRGSNSAMAGPIYYQDENQDHQIRFPSFYEGKLFIYEWARSWIMTVAMDMEGSIVQIEPFLPKMPLSKPIDIEFGPDGAMYILEYGQNYFMNNPQAKLSRIEYHEGNRTPMAKILVDKNFGPAPLEVHFDASQSIDVDIEDSLSISWNFGDGANSTQTKVSHTFNQPGIYKVTLGVSDQSGDKNEKTLNIQVGNTQPQIDINIEGNQSFYLANEQRVYSVEINDPEDMLQGGVDKKQSFIQLAYSTDGEDLELMLGEANSATKLQFLKGKNLIANSDCASCHAMRLSSVGPSYLQISDRYQTNARNIRHLANKVSIGGNGVWGEKIMPGHPQHQIEELQEMVKYILSLKDSTPQSLDLEGSIRLDQHFNTETSGAYILSASYTDKGAEGIPSLSNRSVKILRFPRLEAEEADSLHRAFKGITGQNRNINVLRGIKDSSFLMYRHIDLSNIRSINVHGQFTEGGMMEARLNDPNGQVLGKLNFRKQFIDKNPHQFKDLSFNIQPQDGFHDLYILFKNNKGGKKLNGMIDWIEFNRR